MGFVDLKCKESITLIDSMKSSAYKSEQLRLGCRYRTYLFFDLPALVFFSRISKAMLVLFKIPFNALEASPNLWNKQYSVCPLSEHFSIFSNCYTPPTTIDHLCVAFEDGECAAYTEIDVTEIVVAWGKGIIENKGLMLAGAANAQCLVYASHRHESVGMRPILRLTYEGVTLPLSMAPCTVDILR